MASRLERVRQKLLGDEPRKVLLFVAPTCLAIFLDVCLRARSLAVFPPKQWLNYFGSSLASAGFWGGPLWLASRLFLARGRAARAGLILFSASFVAPLAVFCFGAQPLYYQVFHGYMARDTVRLGIALRGTLGAWLASWGASLFIMIAMGLVAAAGILALSRVAAKPVKSAWPILPIVGFIAAATCFWFDFVESRSLQAAPPDTCFIHGVMHALHDGVTGRGWARRGISLREPDLLPPLTTPAHRPNVILVISESVRADALCSAPGDSCKAQFLDEAAPDRVSLGRLTSQSSGTFTSCVLLWTGLAPDADFRTMHHAPVVWELAHAVGYRTAYVGSQNLRYDDFGAFLRRAGIDVQASAIDLGDSRDPHIGAPDENATARMLAFVREVPPGTPYFAVLHFSNTHWPYRVDPDLQPFAPHDDAPFGQTEKLHNHYRNAVLLQERTFATFLRDLRALPGWDDTVVMFVSDHGEEFREHGGLYHLTTLFDEQVRVPGFLVAGDRAVGPTERAALAAWSPRRTYSEDMHVTLLDLLGVLDQRAGLPFANLVKGRSLLRPPSLLEPAVLLSTASGVWEPDVARYAVMRGDSFVVRPAGAGSTWSCYALKTDPREVMPLPPSRCPALVGLGNRRFADAWK